MLQVIQHLIITQKGGYKMSPVRSLGSEKLDHLLGGGIPDNRALLVVGGPGTGKTTLGVQFLLEGVANKENGLHILLEEYPLSLAQRFDFLRWCGEDITYHEAVQAGYISILDLLSARIGYHEKYDLPNVICPQIYRLGDLMGAIFELVRDHNIKRIVLDSLQSFLLVAEREVVQLREVLLAIIEPYRRIGIGLMVISERSNQKQQASYQFMDYIFDGIISLNKGLPEDPSGRSLQVEKALWAAHDCNSHQFQISPKLGIELIAHP